MGGYPGGYPGYPGGYPGYPYGYGMNPQMQMPGFPQMNPQAAAAAYAQYAQAYSAAQTAHLHAYSAAQAYSAPANQTPTNRSRGKKDNKPLGDEQKANLKTQIEFYFSTSNLCKDVYLRKHMDPEGWTSLELISQFPKVKKFTGNMAEIQKAIGDSSLVELDSGTGKIRLKDEGERTKWAHAPSDEDLKAALAA